MKSERSKGRWRLWVGAVALVALCMPSSVWASVTVDGGATRNVPPAISTDDEYIGYNSAGTLNQTSSTNSAFDLNLGYNSGSSGTYNLSGSGSLSTSFQYIGYGGTGALSQTSGTSAAYALNLGYNSGSSGTYNLSDSGILSATLQYIGYGGTGVFNQTGGTNTNAYNGFYLGYNSGSSGTYNLSGSGSLSTSFQYIGYGGTGVFNQTGGTNDAGEGLVVGFGGSGTYTLSGSGSLSGDGQFIGDEGPGAFNQTGGTNTVRVELRLGYYPGGSGTYTLSSSGSLSAPDEYIGDQGGTGNFTQSGGTNTVANSLNVATNGGSGTYKLQGGTLTAGTINLNSGGIFNQTGGLLNFTTFNQQGGEVQGSLENRGTFNYNSGTFSGRLLNYGTINFNPSFTAGNGMANYSNLTIATGRTITLNGLGLDNSGSLSMAGGVLTGLGPLVNNATMTGYGTIAGSGGFVNNAVFSQGSGNFTLSNTGDNENYGNMFLTSGRIFTLGSGATLYNRGTLALSQAIINGAGDMENPYGGVITGPGTIASNFANSGGALVVGAGTTNITQPFSNSGLIQLTAFAANLTGGALTNFGTIQGFGNTGNPVTNTGTIEALGGTLTLGGAVTNQAGGQMFASTGNKLLVASGLGTNAGLINLTGGTFDNNNHAMGNSGQISGYGTFRSGGLTNSGTMTLSGGTTTVNGDVTNQAAGKITVAYTPAIFTGNVVNQLNATIKNTNTTITWAGSFTNSGAYISDPGTQYFTDLIMTSSGYLQGGVGDKWSVSGNFQNQSTQNKLWNTALSDLVFTGGGTHQLYIPGADVGPNGYGDNFAWGTLDLRGQILSLADANNVLGDALYLAEILGVTLNGKQVTDIYGNGLNIYYDPSCADNNYLGGLTYDLMNGGQLIATPLPPSAWLFLTGLAGLGLLGRRRKGKTT